ncbi:hypothetical protein ACFQZX_04935 [Mucilaginibacter litoreus]|uniref:DUF4440 domain-containing protein n=1 Tax=Mucilaginibacter litoreus TaxID=1048221 RepID=A0ABW3AQ26_9SPHI
MKLIFKIIILLAFPSTIFAQDAAQIKKQAQGIAGALLKGDYQTVLNNTYPKAVEIGGGKAKMLKMMTEGLDQMKAQGFLFEKITIGEPGKFYKAGTEIHCLIPETIVMKTNQGRFAGKSNLLAVSSNGGKSWSFLDLNRGSINAIDQIFPKFNHSLVIPQPQPPVKL